jgi:hypothetical protein
MISSDGFDSLLFFSQAIRLKLIKSKFVHIRYTCAICPNSRFLKKNAEAHLRSKGHEKRAKAKKLFVKIDKTLDIPRTDDSGAFFDVCLKLI